MIGQPRRQTHEVSYRALLAHVVVPDQRERFAQRGGTGLETLE